jgi:hypothetical protein
VDGPNRDQIRDSLLAACMLPFLVVLFYTLFSFFVLLG